MENVICIQFDTNMLGVALVAASTALVLWIQKKLVIDNSNETEDESVDRHL